MSDTPSDSTADGGFVSAYEDNKDSSPSPPMEVQGGGLITPDHTGIAVDDLAEPEDADVQHLVSAEDVEAKE